MPTSIYDRAKRPPNAPFFSIRRLDSDQFGQQWIVTSLALPATLTAVATDREGDVNRTQKAAQVFKEIMNDPYQGIRQDLLKSAKCNAFSKKLEHQMAGGEVWMKRNGQWLIPGYSGTLME